MNSIKTKLHSVLFPSQARMIAMQSDLLAHQAAVAAETERLVERMGDELDSEHRAKKDAWIAIGHYRTQIQAQQMIDGIQKQVIQVLNKKLAERDAEAGKWKGAALEIEEELKSSFFEIAELNKQLDELRGGAESGARDGAHGAQVVPMLAYSA